MPSIRRGRGSERRLGRVYADTVIAWRWVVVVGWVLTAVAALTWLPSFGSAGEKVEGFAANSPAVAAELRAFEIFGFPLTSRVSLVQRDPEGLSPFAQTEAVLRAAALVQGSYDTPLLGGLPVANTLELFPASRERGTTVVTYLFIDPRTGFEQQRRAAEDFAREHLHDPDDAYVGVTGSVPARAEQARLIEESLHAVELATVAAIFIIVVLTFRSLAAGVLALAVAGIAVVVTLGVAGFIAGLLEITLPADLRPLIVALLLGVVTDYCIFFLSGLRNRLADGLSGSESAAQATCEFAPVVGVAGVTVAAGTAALLVAESALFRGFGPGMAITVLVGLVVAVTLVPALLAILGARAFWPSAPGGRGRPAVPPPGPPTPSFVTLAVTRRRTALPIVVGCAAVLTLAAVPLLRLDLGLAFVQSLPEESTVARAAAAAETGFAAGILSPTEILLEADGLAEQPRALARLGQALEEQAGVAAVVGPGDVPVAGAFGVLVARNGDAARYLVVLDSPPLGAQAINDLSALRDRLPQLIEQAGLDGVRVALAGDTALSEGIVEDTTDDLLRISVAALSVNLLMLILFLRSLVAPLYLLASSVLALCATLGLTVWVFQDLLGHAGLTFYVPFAAAVLLVALGSDYNIFAVGHVWQLARRRGLRQAMETAIPESTRAITSAGFALAASFGLLALVPLRPFRELAFALAAGILIDVLVVRALLVPGLLTLVGTASGWPAARLRGSRTRVGTQQTSGSSTR